MSQVRKYASGIRVDRKMPNHRDTDATACRAVWLPLSPVLVLSHLHTACRLYNRSTTEYNGPRRPRRTWWARHAHDEVLNEHAMVLSRPAITPRDLMCTLSAVITRNTQIEDTCIVFESWHISSTHAFVFSCLAIVALGVLYEWLREAQKTMDRKIAATLSAQGKGKARSGGPVSGRYSPEVDSEEAGLLTGLSVLKAGNGYVSFLNSHEMTVSIPMGRRVVIPPSFRASRALLYGAQVFLSFFLMLVFMTYNVSSVPCYNRKGKHQGFIHISRHT
jgi:hypothetical protein